MRTILFWNVAKSPEVLRHLECLAQTYSVDVFILAESPKDVGPVIGGLNQLGIGDYREEVNATAKVRALTRLNARELIHRYTSLGRELAVWTILAPGLNPAELLLAGVHLPSKAGGLNDSDQSSIVGEVIEELVDLEDNRSHRNTILVGDFNMHPYDPGMTSVTGVHGLMTKKLAEKEDRIHRNRPRRRFYNPMWGLFGDRTPGPAGSYYWQSSVLHNPHWAIFDQALARPDLIEKFVDLRILDDDGKHMLVGSEGAPDRNHLSDHLPIIFWLDV